MSIANTPRRAGPFATNGSQTAFPFAFKVFSEDDLRVVSTTAGVDTGLTLTTDYTVVLNGDQEASPGGTVTFNTAPSGSTINILSEVPYTQPAVFTNQGGFYPSVLNNSLDRLTMMAQQLLEKASRALVVSLGETVPAVGGISDGQVLALVNGMLKGVTNDPATATDAAETAVAQAEIAVTAADDAGAAAIIALATTNGGPFDDTATGLASVGEGDAFGVINTTTDTIDFYRDESGVAVDLGISLPNAAAILALGNAISTSSGSAPVALTDVNGVPGLTIDEEGNWLDIDGRDRIGELAAALAAGPVLGLDTAETPTATLQAYRAHYAAQRPRKFSLLLWEGNDPARGSTAVRMPGAPAFSGQTTTVFGTERSGPAQAEEGLALARRDITIDFANESVTLGPKITVERGTEWDNGIGQVVAPMPFRIQQGARAGLIDLIYSAVDPENLAYTTPGSNFDLYLRSSSDNYATATKLIDGDDIYAGLGLTPPDTMAGLNMACGNTQIEVPAGYPNAGRKIIAVYVFGDEGCKVGTVYAEKDSNTWQLGEFFDFSSLGLGIGNGLDAWNEVNLLWTPTGFHIYARSERADGVNPTTYYDLTHRGRFYAYSANGISGWTNKAWLQAPNIGNTPAQALYLDDGSGLCFLGGSTQKAAGERRQYKWFMGSSPTEFFAAAQPLYSSDLAGYGPALRVQAPNGEMWTVLIQEHGDGYLGFNGNSNLYATCFNDAWQFANMETI